MKYLLEHIKFNSSRIFNSEKELLDFIFYIYEGMDENLKIYILTDQNISELKTYSFYIEQQRKLIINKIESTKFNLKNHKNDLIELLKLATPKFKIIIEEQISKIEKEIKNLKEELKQYE